jgi:hypothetical protein
MPLPRARFDPSEPLLDGRRERFAHLRLIGLPAPLAALQAGIRTKEGKPIRDGNAWKIDREPQVIARKAFLGGHEVTVVRETRGYIRNRLMNVITRDLLRDYAIIGDVVLSDVIDETGKPMTIRRIVGIDWDKLKQSEHSATVTSFKFDKETGMMVEFVVDDPMAAIAQIRDMYGLKAPRRTELTGKDGEPIQAALTTRYDISDKPLTPAEWDAEYGAAEN